jgi:hypothetical protein
MSGGGGVTRFLTVGGVITRPPRQKKDCKTLNSELNPICEMLALFGAHHILHVSRVIVKKNYSLLNSFLFGSIIYNLLVAENKI